MTLETEAAKLGAKGVAIIVLIVLALIGLGIVGWFWKDYQALKVKNEAAESVSTVTSQATDALATATDTTQTVRVVVEQKRAQSEQAFEELKRHDPIANDWANQPIPDSVRQLDGSALDRPQDNPTGRGVADKTD